MSEKRILITATKDGEELELKLDGDFVDLSNIVVQLVGILTQDMEIEGVVEYTAMMSAEVLMRKGSTEYVDKDGEKNE